MKYKPMVMIILFSIIFFGMLAYPATKSKDTVVVKDSAVTVIDNDTIRDTIRDTVIKYVYDTTTCDGAYNASIKQKGTMLRIDLEKIDLTRKINIIRPKKPNKSKKKKK